MSSPVRPRLSVVVDEPPAAAFDAVTPVPNSAVALLSRGSLSLSAPGTPQSAKTPRRISPQSTPGHSRASSLNAPPPSPRSGSVSAPMTPRTLKQFFAENEGRLKQRIEEERSTRKKFELRLAGCLLSHCGCIIETNRISAFKKRMKMVNEIAKCCTCGCLCPQGAKVAPMRQQMG